MHGPGLRFPSEKRKELYPHSIDCIFVGYLDGVKGYIIIYLSLDRLIIEHSVKFKESVSHVTQQSHAYIFVLPLVRDDVHAHAKYYLDDISNSEDSDYLERKLVQSDAESVHLDKDAEPE
jgi:hypothetical protein